MTAQLQNAIFQVMNPEEKQEWLETKYGFIPDVPLEESGNWYLGANEIAAIMGLSEYSSPLKVYSIYRKLMDPEEANDQMISGSMMEPYIAQVFQYKYKFPMRKGHIRRHPVYPFLGVTLDYEAQHPEYDWLPVDMKRHKDYPAIKAKYGEPGSDVVPYGETIQSNLQSAFCGASHGCIFVAFHMNFDDMVPFYIPRSEKIVNAAVKAGVDFVHNHLLPGIPPEPTGCAADSELMNLMYRAPLDNVLTVTPQTIADIEARLESARAGGTCDKETIVALETELESAKRTHDAVCKLKKAIPVMDAAAEEVDKFKNILKQAMGDDYNVLQTAYGKVPWRKSKDGSKTDWEAVARALKAPPELIAQHTKTTEGSRRFLTAEIEKG